MAGMDVNYSHNLITLCELCPGDLIEFPRGAYSHWGVYLGEEEVAHLAGEDDDGINAKMKPEYVFTISGVRFNKAKVCIENFWRIVENCRARKNNNSDKKMQPLHPEEIIRNAKAKLGEVGYSLIFKNCEHFAKWCRYGVEKSDQVDNVVTGAAVGMAGGLLLGVVYAFAKFMGGSKKEEEEEEEERRQEL